MTEFKDILKVLPEMKTGKELADAMTVLPDYNSEIRKVNQAVRLTALSDLYNIYIPCKMSFEIYSKLYFALLRSLQKKGTQLAVRQQSENFKMTQQQGGNGIIGGSDSFTVIGTSGIGKSSAVNKAISLITEGGIIETEKPYSKIIPCVVVQCPFDSSVKGLLLEILRKVDEILDSNYYQSALQRKATADMLIGAVSSVALNNIGLLVVDEIQNVVNSKNGKSLVGMLTQLINNSGISICMVGTPESTMFFEQAMHLARRSLGLQYKNMEYGDEFRELCKILYSYQYVQHETEITDSVIEWLYEHSSGVISVVVSLIHDAQEVAILSGREILNIETLNQAYNQRLSLLHDYIKPTVMHKKQTSTRKKKTVNNVFSPTAVSDGDNISIKELVSRAKNEQLDIVDLLKEHFSITEVTA